MLMFLQNPNTWYTMKTAQIKIDGEVYKPNNVFDFCKFLERIELPTGRKMRFLREWVLDHNTGKRKYCKIKLQEDLTPEELDFISNLRNIKTYKPKKVVKQDYKQAKQEKEYRLFEKFWSKLFD